MLSNLAHEYSYMLIMQVEDTKINNKNLDNYKQI